MSTPNGFTDWIGFILSDEGAKVNRSPDEPGGISKYGVSLAAYADYRKANSMPVPAIADIAGLTVDQASTFYAWFLESLMLDQVPASIAYRLADLTTSLGRQGVVTAACVSLGLWPIPVGMTPILIALINATDQRQLIWALSAVWLATKRGISASGAATYGHGWTNRRNAAHARALAMVTT